MPNILIRDVPPHTLEALKLRAKHNRRSVQQEVLRILEDVAEAQVAGHPAEIARAIRVKLSQTGRVFGDSTELIRRDRER